MGSAVWWFSGYGLTHLCTTYPIAQDNISRLCHYTFIPWDEISVSDAIQTTPAV